MNFKSYYPFLFPDEVDSVEKKLEKFEKNQDEIVECILEYVKTKDKDILENINNNIMEEQVCYLKYIFNFMKLSYERFCSVDVEITKLQGEIDTERKKERKTEKGKRQLELNIKALEQKLIDLRRKQEHKLDYPVFRYQFPTVPFLVDPFEKLKNLEEENKRLRRELGKPCIGEIQNMNPDDVILPCKKARKNCSEDGLKVGIVDKIKTINDIGKKKSG
jgi:hypothetical protein